MTLLCDDIFKVAVLVIVSCFIRSVSVDGWEAISSLPDGVCPIGCRCYDKGSVVTCKDSLLTRVPPLISTTIVLDIDYNRINIIYNDSFDQAQYMRIISMENNNIIHIEAGAFVPLAQLRILRLGNNHLAYLPRDIFWKNRNLEVLDLHGNAFVEIPDHVMYYLHSLKLLNMSENHITSPALGPGFKYTTQLSMLDLTGNNFVSLDAHVFQATLFWDEQVPHYLNLSYCGIRHIHQSALSQLYRLEALSLAGNNEIPQNDLRNALHDLEISSLQVLNLANMNISDISDFFTRFQHQRLLHLDLSNNQLQTIPSRSFFYLINLKTLDLSYNNIADIGDLSGLSQLEYLSLAHNNIHDIIHTTFEGLQTAKVLDLSNNNLDTILDGPFEKLWDLHTLYLQQNNIKSFTITTGLENLVNLDLSDNMLEDLGYTKRLRRLENLDVSSNVITRLGPAIFSRDHSLRVVNLSSNIIMDIDEEAFYSSTQETLDLSYNKLTHLLNFGWRRIKNLSLQGNLIFNISSNTFHDLNMISALNLESNNLHELPLVMFSDMFNLRELRLSYNPLGRFVMRDDVMTAMNTLWKLERLELAHIELSSIPKPMLANMTLLKHLNLDGNKLDEMELSTLHLLPRLDYLYLADNQLAMPDVQLFSSISRLKVLDLSHNPLQCTCELMPFRNWIITTNITIVDLNDPLSYYCTGPPEWKGINLYEFHLQSNMCSHHEKAVIFATIGCTLLAIILLILFVIYRYKWWGNNKIQRTYYSAIDETSTVQINHHSHDNREWV